VNAVEIDSAWATPLPRADARFMLNHPAHLIAMGFGCGLSPKAAGTVGTLWAWVSFLVLDSWLSDAQWGIFLLIAFAIGWWASTRCAQALGQCDPGAIVWDEVLAFWFVMWLVMPAGWLGQGIAFVLFRLFDVAKPGPVGWADRRFKARKGEAIGWSHGFGVLFDDAVAALCTLLVIALWKT
jgi:phosphatidylglycerophosphatase A